MAGGIYVVREGGALTRMEEQMYDSEDLLQELLSTYSDLLAGEQIDPEAPRRWLLVQREMGVPDSEDSGDRWSADHLFLDQDGIPTIVEVKRSTDTRARREVVAQMLDYAANAVVYWPVTKIRTAFEQREGYQSELADLLGEGFEEDQFWQRVKTNLQAGKVRMLFVADSIAPELRRIVEFLNGQMNSAEMLAVEIKQFVGDGLQALVPRLVGQTAEAQSSKSSGSSSRQWDETSFFQEMETSRGPVAHQVARQIFEWAENRRLSFWWGKGASNGSMFPQFDCAGVSHYAFGVWTAGGVEIQFQHMLKNEPFSDEAKRIEFCEKLEEIPGVEIPRSKLKKRPSIPLEALEPEKAMAVFQSAMDWYLEQVRAASRQ